MKLQLPNSEQLNIAGLSRLFDRKSECYKLFWFQAIMKYVCDGHQEISFEELIDEMIADAWYMVTEYHLNLGPRDTLEKTVNYIFSITDLAPTVKRHILLEWLKNCSDEQVIDYKQVLIQKVPFHIQTPLINQLDKEVWRYGLKRKIDAFNQQVRLMYYFIGFSGLKTRIYIVTEWMDYLRENQEIIKGWIQYNMILYLQRRNPSVPGISDKLYPPQERKLEKVKKYWKLLSSLSSIHEIYGENLLVPKEISIDHFVPWSYVAHDEFWNLHPTTKPINSSKSNHLPDWNIYFPRFAEIEHLSYQMIWQNDAVQKEFRICAKDHLNNPEIEHRLYRQGLSEAEFKGQLKDVIYPVYLSAQTCGFSSWEYMS